MTEALLVMLVCTCMAHYPALFTLACSPSLSHKHVGTYWDKHTHTHTHTHTHIQPYWLKPAHTDCTTNTHTHTHTQTLHWQTQTHTLTHDTHTVH